MSKFIKLTAMAVAALTISANAVLPANNWYFGGGPEFVKITKENDSNNQFRGNFNSGFGLNTGYNFNDYVGVEFGGVYGTGFTYDDTETYSYKNVSFGGKLQYLLKNEVIVDASSGLHYWNIDGDGFAPYIGIGMAYKVDENVDLVAGYTYYSLGHIRKRAEAVNVGLTLDF